MKSAIGLLTAIIVAGAVGVASAQVGRETGSRSERGEVKAAPKNGAKQEGKRAARPEAKREARPKQEARPKREARPKQEVRSKREATTKQAETPRTKVGKSAPKESGKSTTLREVQGTGRVSVQGQNYTVWRGEHRERVGNRWRTYGAIGALSVLAIGGATLYPYAYLSAPERSCTGETEEGCTLQWTEVETREGPRVYKCVAYCPWQ